MMTVSEKSYIAGFIDADGSIILQLKKRKNAKFLFRIKTTIVLYQDSRYINVIKQLHSIIGSGYVYVRSDHISELRIEGFTQVKRLIKSVLPFLRFKHKQAKLTLEAIEILQNKNVTIKEFIDICKISDEVSSLNYSSKLRINSSAFVISELQKHHLLPVTTGVPIVSG